MPFRKWTLAALAAVSLVLSSCEVPPESRIALSETATADYDERLTGAWYYEADGDSLVVQIKKGRKPRTLDAVWIMVDGKKTFWIHATAFPTEIGGTVYYNIRRTEGIGFDYTAPGEKPGIVIARPVFVGSNVLAVCFLHGNWSSSKFAKLLEKRGIPFQKVEGAPRPRNEVPYLLYGAPREKLRSLLRTAAPAELFGAYVPLYRLGTPKSERDELTRMGKAREKADKKSCPFEWAEKRGQAPTVR